MSGWFHSKEGPIKCSSSSIYGIDSRYTRPFNSIRFPIKNFCSSLVLPATIPLPTSLTGILQRYESHVEAEKEISAEIQVAENSKYSRFMTMGELLQTTGRQLEEASADDLTVTDLSHLENELQSALTQTRSRKTHLMLESVKGLHEKEKLLREENKLLEDNIARIKKNRKVNEMSTDSTDLPPPHVICVQQRVTLNFLQ
ncbi:agamous-like MADS-box protein AGL27 isoform X3 [Lycium ferocissimum]|uniref:agamous-like MADS-box protein AGL27 isoform X3 n=1 Tax=Lycium ferocissimum TaxID=112874 RepID=UPI002815E40F|nr:agamous-like MADS-box protein AGL27 isoform X3 [Lycium ferocissimum]